MFKPKKMNIRSKGYKFLRMANDVNAVAKGKYHKRIVRKFMHKKTGNPINKWMK